MTYQNLKKKLQYSKNKVNKGLEFTSGQSGGIISDLSLELRADLVENFNTTTVNAEYRGYAGCCFDGNRYMYMVTSAGTGATGFLVRYDTWASHSVVGSYSAIDLSTISANYKGCRGCCFDGRYVYINIYHNGTERGHWWLRYDTLATFSTANVQVVDLEPISPYAEGYETLLFDGRYVYGAPLYSDAAGGYNDYCIRYDTTQSFVTGSFETISLNSIVSANILGTAGGCFDGRYVYLCPWRSASGAIVARYDTTKSFTTSAGWEWINMQVVDPNILNIARACFDGRYVYFSPRENISDNDYGMIFRYDTTKDFTTDNIDKKDLSLINANWKHYSDMNFNGKYIYFCPAGSDVENGNVVRYDTTKDFFSDSSYTGLDLKTVNAAYYRYRGCCIVDKYIYLVQYGTNGSTDGNITRIRIKP